MESGGPKAATRAEGNRSRGLRKWPDSFRIDQIEVKTVAFLTKLFHASRISLAALQEFLQA
jgi:hypothetical protein